MDDYDIVRIGEGSYHHLVTLIRRCFGYAVALDQVRAKYATKPFGAADIGFLAIARNGQPAAYYGVFPIIVELLGEQLLAAQSGDTMTDPDHQKRGLFIKLAGLSYELAERSGVKFIFGFPNENSLPGFQRKLGWTFCGHLHDLKLATHGIPMCELSARWPWLAPYHAMVIRRHLAPPGAGALRPATSLPDGLLRDDRFFRYKERNGAHWTTVGRVRFFVKPKVHLYVGEMDVPPGMSDEELSAALISAGRKLLCGKVVCTYSENHPDFARMARITKATRSLPIGYLDLGSGLPIDRLAFSRTDLDTF